MQASPQDPAQALAQTRLDNALALFEEFVRATARHADAATLRGLERRFAERVQIQPSYWSQIKSRSRQIGERLATARARLLQRWKRRPRARPAALQMNRCRATTTSASSSAWCSPTTAATRSARARACSTCSARYWARPRHRFPQPLLRRWSHGAAAP